MVLHTTSVSRDDDAALSGLGALRFAFDLLSSDARLQRGITKQILTAVRDLRAQSPHYLSDADVARLAVAQLS